MLGANETTILGFHNQWLYGRSTIIVALQTLLFNKRTGGQTDNGQYSNIFNKKYQEDMTGRNGIEFVKELIEKTTFILNLQNNDLAALVGRAGFDNSFLLNDEEFWVLNSCTSGDNNDGIIIIDTISNKYCFMNIGSGDSTIMQAKPMIPLSAKEYVELYYPTDISKLDKEDIAYKKKNGKTDEDIDKEIKHNIKLNKKILKDYKHFEVLTLEEVKSIFPKDYKRKVVRNA